ncbi:hypothetical protein [Natronomonas sp. LN261]|uniref:DUF7692 domain-containing protein n=1 Tax=Natronomonas sp. LN261 TaxID=2750669 RepID=UPI0015EFB50F|nr:hypothetical protein [Natronomonas sp. LN261]
MRIRTDGDKAWRTDEIEAAADVVGRNKTDSVVRACSHLVADQEQKAELADNLAGQVSEGAIDPEVATEICDILGDHRNLLFSPSIDICVESEI